MDYLTFFGIEFVIKCFLKIVITVNIVLINSFIVFYTIYIVTAFYFSNWQLNSNELYKVEREWYVLCNQTDTDFVRSIPLIYKTQWVVYIVLELEQRAFKKTRIEPYRPVESIVFYGLLLIYKYYTYSLLKKVFCWLTKYKKNLKFVLSYI